LPDKGNILDETNGLYTRTTDSIKEERSVCKGLGRRLNIIPKKVLKIPFFKFANHRFCFLDVKKIKIYNIKSHSLLFLLE
jgi:hypothetical protein